MEFRPMSPEEIERTLQFLLNHQAQFAADFARLSDKTETIADAVIGLTGIAGRVVDGLDKVTGRLEAVDGRLEKVTERLDQLAEAQQRTDEQLKRTESHLDVLIEMFERHLREDHGHRPS